MANTAIIIEDDKEIAAIVATNIQDLGLETEQVGDGATGLKRVLDGSYSLVILDLMLPQFDGITVCKRIREKDPYTPILMLTAKAEEIDRVLGLELGADDYMTKPFSVRELKARVRALLRRAGTGLAPAEKERSRGEILIGTLAVDLEKRKVVLGDVLLELTVKEFDLLELFISNPGRAYSRADLLNLVWGYQFEGYEHTVNTHINRLRNKIEADPAHPVYLKTVWGVGYRFAESTEVTNT
jgi:DNA-binding response OmpR family regulator